MSISIIEFLKLPQINRLFLKHPTFILWLTIKKINTSLFSQITSFAIVIRSINNNLKREGINIILRYV